MTLRNDEAVAQRLYNLRLVHKTAIIFSIKRKLLQLNSYLD